MEKMLNDFWHGIGTGFTTILKMVLNLLLLGFYDVFIQSSALSFDYYKTKYPSTLKNIEDTLFLCQDLIICVKIKSS